MGWEVIKTGLFGYDNVKKGIIEVIKTFSNKSSYFASKRIERAILFINANALLDICTNYLMTHDKLDWTGAVAIYTAQMGYAAYQTVQIAKEKSATVNKENKVEELKQENSQNDAK